MPKVSKNHKQDIEISELRKDVGFLKQEIAAIKEQVFNHLPTKIDEMGREVNDRVDNMKDKILLGFVVMIVDDRAGIKTMGHNTRSSFIYQ